MKLVIFLGISLLSSLGLASPQILFSGVNVAELTTPDSSVIFTLIATDTAGSESLVGAALTDPTSGATYGGFSAGTQKGTYLISLTLEAIEAVRPIEPSASSGEKRVFRAVVFNSIGESANVDISLRLDRKNKYTQLPRDFFDKFPVEIKGMNQWKDYIGQRNITFKYLGYSSLRVEYLESKNLSTLAYQGWAYNILAKRTGRGLFNELNVSVNEAKISCNTESQDILICSFEILCTQKINSDVNCWKVDEP